MAYEQKDNSGSLFKNDNKTGNQPDYRGTCVVDGVEKEMAAWIKTSKSGKTYMSFSFKEPYKKDSAGAEKQDAPF
jgi:uncharacterized protein (DUF736 family)